MHQSWASLSHTLKLMASQLSLELAWAQGLQAHLDLDADSNHHL
jgi:hypothetical protein